MNNTEATQLSGSSLTPQPEQPAEAQEQRASRRPIQRIKDRLLRPPFSDDVFISYSRADGATYAAGLANKLADQEFSCRFDQWGTQPGRKIPRELRRALRRSALFVLVGTPGAATSEHVADEVIEFKKTKRNIIPIIFEGVRLSDAIYLDGALRKDNAQVTDAPPESAAEVAKARWADDIFGAPLFLEKKNALVEGNPSEEILNRIKKNFTFKRKDERLRKAARLLGGVLMVLAVAVAVAGYIAVSKAEQAVAATREAQRQQQAADESRKVAEEEKVRADQARIDAEEQKQKATDATQKANYAAKVAGEQTILANEATERANEQTKIAEAAKTRADAAKARADAEELKTQTTRARNYYNQAQAESSNDPARALVWAQKALETAPPNDERLGIYKLRALHLTLKAPRIVISTGAAVQRIIYSAGQDKAITTTAANNSYQVWDLRTGKALPDPMADCKCKYRPATEVARPAFSLDGRWAALLYYQPGGQANDREALRLRVWETATGKVQFDVTHAEFKWFSESSLPQMASEALGFSPDGQSVLLTQHVWEQECGDGNSGREILAWERETGRFLKSFETCNIPLDVFGGVNMHFPPISQNPQRNWMLTFRGDREDSVIQVTDASTGKVFKRLRPGKLLDEVALSRDGDHVLIVTSDGKDDSDQQLSVWDIGSESLSTPISLKGINVLDASRDGGKLLIADKDYKILSILALKGNVSTPVVNMPRTDMWLGAELTADEQHVVTTLRGQHPQQWEINVWETSSGAQIVPPIVVRRDEDKSFLTSASAMTLTMLENSSGVITVHDLKQKGAENLLPSANLPLPKGREFLQAFMTPDGGAVITMEKEIEEPLGGATTQLWDLKTAQPLWKPALVTESMPFLFNFSPDGNRIVFRAAEKNESGDGFWAIRMRTLSTGELVPGFRPIVGHYDSVDFSRDGTQLVTVAVGTKGWEARRWDALTGEALGASVRGTAPGMDFHTVTRHGEFLVLVPDDSSYISDPKEFVVRSLKQGDERQLRFNFTKDEGSALALALLQQAQEIVFNGDNSLSASFGPDLSVILTAAESGATISYREAGREYLAPYKDIISFQNIKLSPDGKLLITRTPENNGKGLRVWETKTGQPVTEVMLHEAIISEFLFTSDGERLITVTRDGRVRSWYVGSTRGGRPEWMSRIGEALTGLSLQSDTDVTRIEQTDYVELRRQYESTLLRAGKSDEAARFVLDNWIK